jgi:DNA gyrase/topoisomerase IV subunit A
MIKEKTITQVIDGGYLDYAMYVLESRAIPSVIDGQKTVNRKLIHAMLTEHGGKRTKLVDLGSISKFNYHHGESSATEAASNMAASWNNNAPLFEQHGNFGSRLVQEPSSPRYIHASLSENFKKFFIDTEVAPSNFDTENPEPAYYLPIIPWVLVNGVSGIAVGFKCDIMPRAIKDVVAATKSYLKAPQKFLKENAPIVPTFPNFRGTIERRGENQWKTRGIIDYKGKNTYVISELPWGYDRASYVTLLNELCDKDLIKDYTDDCSKSGFGFTVKVSVSDKTKIDADPYKYFSLDKIHTEILTTMGVDGKLKIFYSVAELIAYFCDFRVTKFADKIEYDKVKITEELHVLMDKIIFVNEVVTDQIDFKSTSKADLLDHIFKHVTEEEHGKRFVNIPLYECTVDGIAALREKEIELNKTLEILSGTIPEKVFLEKLNKV